MSTAYRPVGALTTTDSTPMFTDTFSLPVSMQYLYGSLRSDDGRYFWPIRGSYRHRARHLHVSEATFTPGSDGGLDSVGDFTYTVGTGEGYEGDVTWEPSDGSWEVRRSDGGGTLMTIGDTAVSWQDSDSVSLTGSLEGVSLQFSVRAPDWPFVYSSRLFKVDRGTVNGTTVSGWVFHDSLHLPEGEHFLTSPYQRELQGAWVAFVTEYADGTLHAGHLVYGLDGFCVLVVHRTDGPPLITHDVDVAVEVDDQDFPTRITYTGGGEAWEWVGYDGGRMPIRPDIAADHRWRQGVVRPLGETRTVVSAEALMETYQDRLRDKIRSA